MEKQNKKNGGRMKIPVILISFLLTGCSYNISMAHTEGRADDVIDETMSPTTRISALPTWKI
jgi:uncharacterized protein YcfL